MCGDGGRKAKRVYSRLGSGVDRKPRRRHEVLQRQVPGPVGHLDVGDVLEAARLRDVRFVREPADRSRPMLLFPVVFRPAAGAGQPDVLRVGREPLNVRPELLGGVGAVEAQTHQLRVVGGQAHGVETLAGHLVRRQVVDRVLPQGEARAAFHEQYLDARLVPRPRLATIVQHHRDAGVLQIPAALDRRRVVQVHVGHRSAHVHLNKPKQIKKKKKLRDAGGAI